jgi:hypothetical protein
MKILFYEIVYDVDYGDGQGYGNECYSDRVRATDAEDACKQFKEHYMLSGECRILGVKPIIYRGSDGDVFDKWRKEIYDFRDSVARNVGETEKRN